jgi:hypothetical protein
MDPFNSVRGDNTQGKVGLTLQVELSVHTHTCVLADTHLHSHNLSISLSHTYTISPTHLHTHTLQALEEALREAQPHAASVDTPAGTFPFHPTAYFALIVTSLLQNVQREDHAAKELFCILQVRVCVCVVL